MAKAKQIILSNPSIVLIFVFLAIFPLGHLISREIYVWGQRIVIVPIDIIAGITTTFALGNKKRFRSVLTNPHPILLALVMSFLYSATLFSIAELVVGTLYLLRVFAYIGMGYFLTDQLKGKDLLVQNIYELLTLVCLVVSVIGLYQYFFIPDLRGSVVFGWDAHWYRLVGSFIDPGFTGIILTFGYLTTLSIYSKQLKARYLVILGIIMISLLLTYSRASYLAFVFGNALLFFFVKKPVKKMAIASIILLFVALPLLPRPAGVGVKLERTHSVVTRVENYNETFELWKTSPLIGYGFNMLCPAKKKVIGSNNLGEHSCSGADSWPLLILSTVGLVGSLVLLPLFFRFGVNINMNFIGVAFASSLVALLVHSLFTNSLFYPWVMGYLSILYSLSKSSTA